MRSILATTAIVLTMTAAADASTLWEGDLFIAAANTACATVGVSAGDFWQAVFAPKNLTGNSKTSDQFAVFRPRGSAAQITPNTGTLNGSTVVTMTVIENAAVKTNKDVTFSPAIKVVPATITATTPSVEVTMAVTGLDGVGCNVTFHGILAHRPGNLPN